MNSSKILKRNKSEQTVSKRNLNKSSILSVGGSRPETFSRKNDCGHNEGISHDEDDTHSL